MTMSDSFELDRVAIRMVKEPPLYSDVNLNSPQTVVKLMADTLKDMDREVFAVVNLRTD
jgi:DNA repair protein RadC